MALIDLLTFLLGLLTFLGVLLGFLVVAAFYLLDKAGEYRVQANKLAINLREIDTHFEVKDADVIALSKLPRSVGDMVDSLLQIMKTTTYVVAASGTAVAVAMGLLVLVDVSLTVQGMIVPGGATALFFSVVFTVKLFSRVIELSGTFGKLQLVLAKLESRQVKLAKNGQETVYRPDG